MHFVIVFNNFNVFTCTWINVHYTLALETYETYEAVQYAFY